MQIVNSIGQALFTSFSMFWEILWPLILGFTLSGIVQALVSHQAMAKTLGCDGPKCLTFATLFGIASSSCSYAAVALARSIFVKGASFTAAMVFELASTNLVIELGIILIILMGWQFAAAEFVGGILMVIFIALIFRLTLTPKLVQNGGTRGNGYERIRRVFFLTALQWERIYGCKSLLRDGLGICLGRYRAWAAHCWRLSCVGSRFILECIFLDQSTDAGKNRRPSCWSISSYFQFCVFRWQRATGSSVVEGWH